MAWRIGKIGKMRHEGTVSVTVDQRNAQAHQHVGAGNVSREV